MTKRIERSRIESGKVELPRKLGFLTAERVDFLSVTDRNGEFSVDMPVAALSRLVKAKAELKALKGERKSSAATHASAMEAEKDAHAETQAALAKAERRIKALTKKLEGATPGKDAAGAPKEVRSAPGAVSDTETPPTTASVAPTAPKKVSSKKAVAKAAEAVVDPDAASKGPAAQP